MSDDELRQACEQLYDEQLVPSGRLAAVNALLRFAKQQQANALREAAEETYRITDFSDVAWHRKELEFRANAMEDELK